MQFKSALLSALENYKSYYETRGVIMPNHRCVDVEHLAELLRTKDNVLELRSEFIAHYNKMQVHWAGGIISLLDFSILRKNLRPILFGKLYTERALEKACLNKLMEENSQHHRQMQESEIAFRERISVLENDLVTMRNENTRLQQENAWLKTANRKMRLEIQKLHELLNNKNIPIPSFDEYLENEFVMIDADDDMAENNSLPTDHIADDFTIRKVANEGEDITFLRGEMSQLREDLNEARKLVERLYSKIDELSKDNHSLQESKEELYQKNMQLMQKRLQATENRIKNIENMPHVNQQTCVAKNINNKPRLNFFKSST
jgi:predicted  nucleic acid-binding Zn-ribbon protein